MLNNIFSKVVGDLEGRKQKTEIDTKRLKPVLKIMCWTMILFISLPACWSSKTMPHHGKSMKSLRDLTNLPIGTGIWTMQIFWTFHIYLSSRHSSKLSQFPSSRGSCWSIWTSSSSTLCIFWPPKGHWCSQHLYPYSTKGTGLHQSCQRHCVSSMSNNRDAFNLQCQALQYCHPQNPLFLLSLIQGMKNHQGDRFEYLSDSQVHSNTAISFGISLSFTVLKSIGAEMLWAWFWG